MRNCLGLLQQTVEAEFSQRIENIFKFLLLTLELPFQILYFVLSFFRYKPQPTDLLTPFILAVLLVLEVFIQVTWPMTLYRKLTTTNNVSCILFIISSLLCLAALIANKYLNFVFNSPALIVAVITLGLITPFTCFTRNNELTIYTYKKNSLSDFAKHILTLFIIAAPIITFYLDTHILTINISTAIALGFIVPAICLICALTSCALYVAKNHSFTAPVFYEIGELDKIFQLHEIKETLEHPCNNEKNMQEQVLKFNKIITDSNSDEDLKGLEQLGISALASSINKS